MSWYDRLASWKIEEKESSGSPILAQIKSKNTDYEELARLVIQTFGSNLDLLSLLKKKYVEQPSAYVGCDPVYPYFRAGQNDIIQQFIKIMEEALNVTIK